MNGKKKAQSASIGLSFILCASVILGSQASAEGISAATPDALKKLNIPAQADIVVSGGGGRGEWAFVMGPLHDKERQKLRLMRPAEKDGKGVLFQCERSSGSMEMALSMPGVAYKVGVPQDVALEIGALMQFVKMDVTEVPPPGRPPVFVVKGDAVPAILKAMGNVSARSVDGRMSFGIQKKFAAFELPRPREIPKTASALCSAWSASHGAARGG